MGQKRNEDDIIDIDNRLQAARLALGLSQKDISGFLIIPVKRGQFNI